jgi:hypothetical protein
LCSFQVCKWASKQVGKWAESKLTDSTFAAI